MFEEISGLRRGVRALRVPRGLLFHDPLNWRLFSAPSGLPPEKLRRFLERNGLNDGAAEPRKRPRVRQIFWVPISDLPSRELRTPPGARFACACCGTSCKTFNLGPLLPADVERLKKLDWTGTGHDPATFFVDREDRPLGEVSEPFLRRGPGGCQFLQPDNLCGVHARFGMMAKPLMCRLFPYTFRATPTSIAVGMRLGECSSAPIASKGLPVVDQQADLRQLLAEIDQIGLVPPTVWANADRLITWEEYERIEAAFFALPVGEFVPAVFRAFEADAEPKPGIEAIVSRLGLGSPTPKALDAEALALEDRFCRGAVFGKELFLHQDLAKAAALLAIKVHLARVEARDGSPEALNEAWKAGADRTLRDLCSDLDVRGIAAQIAASWT